MKGLLAPLITAVVLVDAATHYPIQYADKIEQTAVAPLNVEPSNLPQFDGVYQGKPTNDQDFEPASTENVVSKPSNSENPNDDNVLDSDEELDVKQTPTDLIDENQIPEPSQPGAKLDFVDDELLKPAGIDFPDGQSVEKDFDQVEIATTNNFMTSTVYTTVTSTVTDCVSTVTDCAEKGSIVTKTISLYTTVCPVTTPTSVATPTPVASHSDELDSPESESPELDASESDDPELDAPESDDLESEIPNTDDQEPEMEPDFEPGTEYDSDIPSAPEPTKGPYLTKTIEETVWYTVTDCAPKETECPIGQETSFVHTRTEIYPATDLPHILSSNSTHIQPYATSAPSSFPEPPHTNVTIPTTPPNFTVNAGSTQKANGILMGFSLIAASAIALMQAWY